MFCRPTSPRPRVMVTFLLGMCTGTTLSGCFPVREIRYGSPEQIQADHARGEYFVSGENRDLCVGLEIYATAEEDIVIHRIGDTNPILWANVPVTGNVDDLFIARYGNDPRKVTRLAISRGKYSGRQYQISCKGVGVFYLPIPVES